MIKSKEELKKVLILKNQLITLESDGLVKLYKNVSDYDNFLESVKSVIENDSSILLFGDEYINKVFRVIDMHRYSINDKSTKDKINDVILGLNKIDNIEDKEKLVEKYLTYQENTRWCSFTSADDVLYTLSYDAVVLAGLEKDDIPVEYDDLFMSSIRYFLEVYPKLFEDEKILYKVCARLEIIKSIRGFKNRIYRKEANNISKVLRKISLKEE